MARSEEARLSNALSRLEQQTPDIPNFAARIELARRTDLIAFAKLVYPEYEDRPYLRAIATGLMAMCDYYESAGEKGVQNSVVSLPRRYGKSELSRIFAVYFLARNPNARVILVSYGSTLSNKHSRAARDYAMQEKVSRIFPQLTMASDSKGRAEWDLRYFRGGMDASGISGGLTGKGFDLLLADDLIKSWADANSEVVNEAIWDDFQASVLSGANAAYAIKLCIGTRWTSSDPIGRLLKGAETEVDDIREEGWLDFTMPALADGYSVIELDGKVIYEREHGTPLFEERHTVPQLMKLEEQTPHYLWQAQWQQRPVEEVGKVIRAAWIKDALVYMTPPKFTRLARGWDLAWSSTDLSDWSVGVKMGLDEEGRFWILDMERFRLNYEDLVPRIANIIQRDEPECVQFIESNARGQDALRLLNLDSRLYKRPIRGLRVSTDKLTRAQPFIGRLAEGFLKIKNTTWTKQMSDEFLVFSGTKDRHDDIVDAVSLCYNGIAGNSRMEIGTSRIYV